MGYDWKHNGIVNLKPGVTFTQVKAAWREVSPFEEEDPQLPLEIEQTGTFDTEDFGHFIVANGQLDYSFDGNSSVDDDTVNAFLEVVADRFCAKGWIDYQDEDDEVPFGATDLEKAWAELAAAEVDLQLAQDAVKRAAAKVKELQP